MDLKSSETYPIKKKIRNQKEKTLPHQDSQHLSPRIIYIAEHKPHEAIPVTGLLVILFVAVICKNCNGVNQPWYGTLVLSSSLNQHFINCIHFAIDSVSEQPPAGIKASKL